MESRQKYYPYKSDKPTKKFYIITNDNKKVYFGDSAYEHYTGPEGHGDERRKLAYISRHRTPRENWSDPNTASYWAAKFLWFEKSYEQAYKKIRKDLKEKGYL